jgi:hypothetical protein
LSCTMSSFVFILHLRQVHATFAKLPTYLCLLSNWDYEHEVIYLACFWDRVLFNCLWGFLQLWFSCFCLLWLQICSTSSIPVTYENKRKILGLILF